MVAPVRLLRIVTTTDGPHKPSTGFSTPAAAALPPRCGRRGTRSGADRMHRRRGRQNVTRGVTLGASRGCHIVVGGEPAMRLITAYAASAAMSLLVLPAAA